MIKIKHYSNAKMCKEMNTTLIIECKKVNTIPEDNTLFLFRYIV